MPNRFIGPDFQAVGEARNTWDIGMTGDGSALHMVLTGDPGLFAIVRLSLMSA